MIKHKYTEETEINFSKLKERIMAINDEKLCKADDVRRMIVNLMVDCRPTLIMATGGSKVIAYYLQGIIEHLGIITEVIEPRDYYYKNNLNCFSNLIMISASGKTNGIKDSISNFKGNKFLITEKYKELDCDVIAWGNENYEKEKSFISLSTSLGPMALMLDAVNYLDNELDIKNVNEKIDNMLSKSSSKIDSLSVNFKDIPLIQVMSGYDTKTSSYVLESNIVETGLASCVIHDKGAFCHGRSNLLYQNPNSCMIYLTHKETELDNLLLDTLKREYPNILLFDTSDLDENYFFKEYYLTLQMYYLSKKIASDRNIELTMPEYNEKVIKKVYNYRGEM